MKVGKDFKKTNSQQACKIDVNKASKLLEVFNKVGWFEKRHFSRVIRHHQSVYKDFLEDYNEDSLWLIETKNDTGSRI